MANSSEILHANSKKVFCDGLRDTKDGASGHPLVYLNMGEKDFVVCPYCSKRFTINKIAVKNFGENK